MVWYFTEEVGAALRIRSAQGEGEGYGLGEQLRWAFPDEAEGVESGACVLDGGGEEVEVGLGGGDFFWVDIAVGLLEGVEPVDFGGEEVVHGLVGVGDRA